MPMAVTQLLMLKGKSSISQTGLSTSLYPQLGENTYSQYSVAKGKNQQNIDFFTRFFSATKSSIGYNN